jgi:hypothetical protein
MKDLPKYCHLLVKSLGNAPESYDASADKLVPRWLAFEIVLGIALFVAGVALAWHAVIEARLGKQFTGVEFLGIALIIFGGCFDPVNFVCLCFPFVSRDVAISPPFKKLGWTFWGVGFVLAVAGWVGEHWV